MTPVPVAEAFRAAYGATPEGVWAAPGRVNLIGEHVDYNDGLVLPFAMNRVTHLAATVRSDQTVRLASLQADSEPMTFDLGDLAPGTPRGWGAYVAGVLWSMGIDRGLDLMIDGHVPVGSGLSSSGALVSVTALMLNELLDLRYDRPDLARLAQEAENGFVGAPTGRMDQMASLLCRAGHVLLYDVRSGETEHIPFDPPAAGLEVTVINTRVSHRLATNEYAARRSDCEAAARRLGLASLRDLAPSDLEESLARLGDDRLARRTRHVVTEIERVRGAVAALGAGEWSRLGSLLNASHGSLRDDYEVSCPELDTAVESALGAGALGARMTGGGFGGSAIALVAAARVDATSAAMKVAFGERGLAEPEVFTVIPSVGAARLV